MPAPKFDVLIVGAGHAGAQAAAFLRQQNFSGTIGLISDEPHLPYERPPLSKDYLSEEKSFDRLLLKPASFWVERNITLLTAQRVTHVDPRERCVRTGAGDRFLYGRLIWATGGAARRLSLPGSELRGVHVLRKRDDVDAIHRELPRVHNIVIVGAGHIGLEAAACFSSKGLRTTVVECTDRVLSRVTGETVARFFESEHAQRGVRIELNARAAQFLENSGHVAGLRLSDGRTAPADLVLVGVGITPSTEPLTQAGAHGIDGVDVDEFCRTSLDGIYAIGDCAAHVNGYASSRRIRIESVQNATDMAMTAAKHITGSVAPYVAAPWFWSNQYDLKLQTLGLSVGYDQMVVRGDPSTRSFSVIYLRDSRLAAIDSINCTRDFVQARGRLLAPVEADIRELSDINRPLKSLFASAAQLRCADHP